MDSPCEQLCYELHDGMFECDCKEGYLLSKDGYSCMGKSLLHLRYKLNTVYMFFSFLVDMDLEDKVISYFTKTECILLYSAFKV